MSDLFYINTRICFKGLQGDIRIGLFVRSDIRDKGIQGNWDLASVLVILVNFYPNISLSDWKSGVYAC